MLELTQGKRWKVTNYKYFGKKKQKTFLSKIELYFFYLSWMKIQVFKFTIFIFHQSTKKLVCDGTFQTTGVEPWASGKNGLISYGRIIETIFERNRTFYFQRWMNK